jgi:hypothetical protein
MIEMNKIRSFAINPMSSKLNVNCSREGELQLSATWHLPLEEWQKA